MAEAMSPKLHLTYVGGNGGGGASSSEMADDSGKSHAASYYCSVRVQSRGASESAK